MLCNKSGLFFIYCRPLGQTGSVKTNRYGGEKASLDILHLSEHVMMSRYESQAEGADESRRKQEQKKVNDALLTKLQELDTDIVFSTGRFLNICAPIWYIVFYI